MPNSWANIFSYGCYSCKWKENGNDETFRLEKISFGVLLITFLLCTSWLYSWSILNNDSNDVNGFLYDELDVWIPWYLIILIVSVIATAYILSVFISGLICILYRKPLHLSICNKILVVLCFCFAIAGYIVIGMEWPDPNAQWGSIVASFQITGPFLQICAAIIWALFAMYIGVVLKRMHSNVLRAVVFGLYLTAFLFILSIPLWFYSPCIYSGKHSLSKPLIIGHRGAPSLAPENTMYSYEKAVTCNVFGMESDVRISLDGVPFLMHDSSLLRTTNVAQVFPERKDHAAESFTWAELQQLNAGKWFLDKNPFLTNGALTEADRANISSQKIPSLLKWATFAGSNNKSIIFDLSRPPRGHINHDNWYIVTAEILLQSGIPQHLVLWIDASQQDINAVKQLAPGFKIVADHIADNENSTWVDYLNLLYTLITEDVLSLNYSLIAYTIDSGWTLTRAWCQGVDVITSDFSCKMNAMKRPSWSLTESQYLGMWIPVDVIALLIFVCVLYFSYKKFQTDERQLVTQFFYHGMPGDSQSRNLNLEDTSNSQLDSQTTVFIG